MIDATHADIHWGEKIFEMYSKEIALVYDKNTELSQADQKLVKNAAVRLKKFLSVNCGLKKALMMVGNFARALVDPETVDKICTLIPNERVSVVKQYVNLYAQMKFIYRAT